MRLTWKGWWVGLLTLAPFAFLNLRNRCSPGFCGEFGFPETYRTWSDNIPIVNGKILGGPTFSLPALLEDLGLAISVATAVTVLAGFRKARDQHAA